MFLALVLCFFTISHCTRDDTSLQQHITANDVSSQGIDKSRALQSVGTGVCDHLNEVTQAELEVQSTGVTKDHIAQLLPRINDVDTFKAARQALDEFGGAPMILKELESEGFVKDGRLTVGTSPFNFFARVAAGEMKQLDMEKEQKALGTWKSEFMIVKNKAESDAAWESDDPEKIKFASMSLRHRFLTVKDLDWQWFNVLVFGKVPEGANLRDAISRLNKLKYAALQWAKDIGGWSPQIGLYVNCYGHAGVNSFFLHILDMSKLGPAFQYHADKNLPLDDVLTVLRQELRAAEAMTTQSQVATKSQAPI